MEKVAVGIHNYNCQLVFDYLPGIYLILKPDPPDFTILGFNQARAHATMSDRSAIGKPLFEAFTDNPDNPAATGVSNLKQSLLTVLHTKKPYKMALQRYDLRNPVTGQFEEKYWSPVNIPVLDAQGDVYCLVHAVEDVTENVLLEQKDKRSQAALDHLHREQTRILESIGDAFLSVDQDWTVRYWNKAAEGIFQINRDAILGHSLWDYLNTENDAKLHSTFYEVMQTGRPAHFETLYAGRLWLQVSAYPSEQGMTAFLVNVTDERKAEEAVRSTERRFGALIENVSDGLAIISKDRRTRFISPSGQRILGYAPEELSSRKREDLIHPNDVDYLRSVYQKIFAQPGLVETAEYRVRMKDGRYKWIEGSFQNFLHEPTIQGVILSFRDISQRKANQERLQASEERYRYLFHHSPATIIVWTLDDLQIQEVNQTAVDLYGYTHNEFLEKTVLDIRPVEEHERIIAAATELKQSANPRSGIWLHQKKSGERIYMDIFFHRIIYKGKDAVLAQGMNITERIRLQHKLEEERNRRQREITEAVLMTQENERSELGRELHDNINQILTTSRLFIEHALSKETVDKNLLQQSWNYLGRAIEEIRQLSRTLMPPSMGEVSLELGLEELFTNVKQLRGIEFTFDFSVDDEDLIPPKLKLTVFRIVQEKLNNIIRHARATQAHVGVYKKANRLQVIVEDNGIGFQKDQILRGMGLRNISSRAQLMGGQVTIDSAPGKGTVLKVDFPLAED